MHAHDVRSCTDASQELETRSKILILEQDEYLASLMHLLLHREGFAISAITSVDQFRPHLESSMLPIILFVSHHWLREDNPQILQKIRENTLWQTVPVIMMMNYYDLDLIEHVTRQGVTDHLLQPFEPFALIDMIQKYTKGSHIH